MRRLLPVGILFIGLVGCGGGGGTTTPNPDDDPGRDPVQDGDDLPVFDPGATRPFFETGQTDPDAVDLERVFVGDRIINWDRLNLLHLAGADSITLDIAAPLSLEDFLASLSYRVEISPEPTTAPPNPSAPTAEKIILTQGTLPQVGRMSPVDLDAGVVRFLSHSGTLDRFTRPIAGGSITALVRPGQLYRASIISGHAETGEFEKDSVYMGPDEFQFISSSRQLEGFHVDMDTENLVNNIRVGDQRLLFQDSVLELLRLGQEDSITIELNTNVDPALFVSSLRWELMIQNLTENRFVVMDLADLMASGTFSIPLGVDPITGAFNNVIVWTSNSGTLDTFTNAQDGTDAVIGKVGDELLMTFRLVSGQLANGDRLTFRDKTFRILYIRA